ncbi:hypothetical protein [Streptomyces monashensis]|uniref:Chaplin domain-containing protein n=1 Tax=Streptomyces monashensis TaxID=1678012 RepID=A0A1S2Q849_9ACTN|nr:hypothetical protein [Streptomyces monashensis]OIK02234.1 hypothetical protein BIV23_25665 [Streptomyces monashensis]
MRKIITTTALALATIAVAAPAHADSGSGGNGSVATAPTGDMSRTLLCALTSITGVGSGTHFSACVNGDTAQP